MQNVPVLLGYGKPVAAHLPYGVAFTYACPQVELHGGSFHEKFRSQVVVSTFAPEFAHLALVRAHGPLRPDDPLNEPYEFRANFEAN